MTTYLGGDHYRPDTNVINGTNPYLQQSLKLIVEAIKGEKEDQLFYEYLISEAPTQEEKDIIASIRDDEVKHNKMFKQLYKQLTNKEIPSENGEEFVRPASYLDGIKQALFGELKAVEKYRTIWMGLPTQQYRDKLFEIITDELKHASKYNYLYTLNRTEERLTRETPDQTTENMGSSPKTTSQTTESTESLPDQWVQYIQPLVTRAMKEAEAGIYLKHLFREFILAGVLVGNQFTPDQAIEQVQQWEKTGESKLLRESNQIKM